MIDDTLALDLCRYVNGYIFKNIWNEPCKEYRRNIHPKMLFERSKSGTIYYNQYPIQLPTTTTSYHVYIMPLSFFGGIKINASEWISVYDYMQEYPELSLRIHGDHGEWMYRKDVHLLYSEEYDVVFMAVNRVMMEQCFLTKRDDEYGTTFDPKDIYVAVYLDSDIVNTYNVECYHPTSTSERAYAYAQCSGATTIFVNGRETILEAEGELPVGSYVEIIKDDNIVSSFDIDLGTEDGARVFMSTEDSCTKYIIHIPKSLNLDNDIITHNTCDVFIRPRNTEDKRFNGLFIHRCQGRENSISQLTHNDFTLPQYIVTDYKSALDTDEVTLHVVCRKHSKGNTLIRDKNYIDLLYIHTDEQILDFLEGNPDPSLFENMEGSVTKDDFWFWKADTMEQSAFKTMLEDVPNIVTLDTMTTHVEALGYNHVLSLICRRVVRFVASENLENTFVVSKPVVFGTNQSHALVYINGIKVREDYVSNEDTLHGTSIITLDSSITINSGDEFVIEFFQFSYKDAIVLEPEVGNETLVIDIPDFKLYEEETDITPTQGIESSSDKSYNLIEDISSVGTLTETEMGYELEFNAGAFGKTFVAQDAKIVNRSIHTLEGITAVNDPLVFEIRQPIKDTMTETVPVIDYKSVFVFLNGKALVEGVDYYIKKNLNWKGNVSFIQVVIQNVSFVEASDNYAEVIVTQDPIRSSGHGYSKNDSVNVVENIPFWMNTLSMLNLDGNVIREVDFSDGRMVVVGESPEPGSLYGVRTVVPDDAKNFLDTYHTDDDTPRFMFLREYFNQYTPGPEMIIMSNSHKLYSIFLQCILRDVLNGTKELAFDPEAESMFLQTTEYEYLKDMDLINTNPQDLDFVDEFPSYINHNIEVRSDYPAILQLMKAYLREDTVTDGDAITVH